MSEERLNPFFDFNAKIEATIKDAKNIIEKHKEDNSCEPQDFVCLAYDTINCLNQLQQENKELTKYKNAWNELKNDNTELIEYNNRAIKDCKLYKNRKMYLLEQKYNLNGDK